MNSKFTENIITVHGDYGQEWLNSLSTLTKTLAQKWQLSDLKPVRNLSYNYVLSGKQNDESIILKITPHKPTQLREIEALIHLKHGAVEILAHDIQYGAILMPQLLPGYDLTKLAKKSPSAALDIACDVVQKLQSNPLPKTQFEHILHISEWTKILDEKWPLIPKRNLLIARKLRDGLLDTMGKEVVLHGDLHYENILQQNNEWFAIDPKGVIGEREAEIWILVRENGLIDQAANHLQLDAARIRKWGYVMSVIAACWRIEDNLPTEEFINYIKTFDK